MTNSPLVKLSLAATAEAPYLARQVVGAVTTGAPSVRTFDLTLLTSELVTRLVDGATAIDLTITEEGRSIRLSVTSDSMSENRFDDLVAALLDRLATRWGRGDDAVWFEIELVRRHVLDDMSEEELFALLPDHDARAEIFDRFVGFATALARRFTRSRVAFDDLEQVAAMALVKSIDRFDLAVGAKFTTFAAETIKGEMKRHLRDTSWSMRVPRGMKEATLRLRRAENELGQALGRDPTPDELAEEAQIDPSEVQSVLLASEAYSTTSLDAPLGGDEDGISLASVLGVEDPALQRAEAWQAVEAAMSTLPERERHILYLRFFEDLSQSEIAEAVGVSQMHVSRLLARSIGDIRSIVGETA